MNVRAQNQIQKSLSMKSIIFNEYFYGMHTVQSVKEKLSPCL